MENNDKDQQAFEASSQEYADKELKDEMHVLYYHVAASAFKYAWQAALSYARSQPVQEAGGQTFIMVKAEWIDGKWMVLGLDEIDQEHGQLHRLFSPSDIYPTIPQPKEAMTEDEAVDIMRSSLTPSCQYHEKDGYPFATLSDEKIRDSYRALLAAQKAKA